jgi:hypothetical protein
MSSLDWSDFNKKRKPTRRQVSLYRRWKRYLSHSRLCPEEQEARARRFAELGERPPV